MISHTRHTRLWVACTAVLPLVAGLGGISTAAGEDRPVFSGRATAVTAKIDWGHLRYSDKAAGVKITADKPFTSTDVYPWPDADGGGTVTGTTTSGAPFRSEIIDTGEPGRQDWFMLDVAGAAGNLEGGNIQVHKPCKDQ